MNVDKIGFMSPQRFPLALLGDSIRSIIFEEKKKKLCMLSCCFSMMHT